MNATAIQAVEKLPRKRGEGGITWPNKNSRCWQISFPVDGRQHRESSGTADYDEAVKVLAKRMAEVAAGQKVLASQKTVRYEDLRALLVEDYRNNGKVIRTKKNGADYFPGQPTLDKFFKDTAVVRITPDKLKEYLAECRENELSDPTVRRHLNSVKRMFTLGMAEGKITSRPHFPSLKDSDPNMMYIPPADFLKILDSIPMQSQPLFKFMYFCGCREAAAMRVTWDMVTADCSELELPGKFTKAKTPLAIPLVGAGGLGDISDMLKTMTREPGKKIFRSTNFRQVWKNAVLASKMGGVNPETGEIKPRIHDSRVSAAKNLIKAGVPATVVMQIGGWKTMAMFIRYNILDREEVKKALLMGAEWVRKQQV